MPTTARQKTAPLKKLFHSSDGYTGQSLFYQKARAVDGSIRLSHVRKFWKSRKYIQRINRSARISNAYRCVVNISTNSMKRTSRTYKNIVPVMTVLGTYLSLIVYHDMLLPILSKPRNLLRWSKHSRRYTTTVTENPTFSGLIPALNSLASP